MDYSSLNTQIQQTLGSLSGYIPELIIALALCLILIVDLIFYSKEKSNWWVGYINVLFILVALFFQFLTFSGGLSQFMKGVVLSGGLLFVLFTLTIRANTKKPAEQYMVFNGLLLGARY